MGKKKYTKDDFITKAVRVHGDTYNYALVDYQGDSSIVEIICKEHGVFKQRAKNHFVGKGCKKCAHEKAGKKRKANIHNGAGVYMIKSIINPSLFYIGSSVNVNKRRDQHQHHLRRGNSENPLLQAHYNKYGESDLVFSLIYACDKEFLVHFEQIFMDCLKPTFNISPTAGSTKGALKSDEWTEEHSRRMTGRTSPRKGKPANLPPDSLQRLRDAAKGNHYRHDFLVKQKENATAE